ncbi:hypothetical protein L7F22_012715 [Adiantum nelumboides]|nr:hypothetical protein [Adiantum nelumboides]
MLVTIRFILLFAEIARPLYKLLIEFKWTEECDQAYEVLKKALVSAPILRAPDWNVIFHVHIDASNFAIGCVLTQPGEHKLDYPISFASRQLNDAEKNYTTIEREGLAMIYSVKKFRYYLLATKFVFYVDHQALLYLVNKPCATGRISRWLLILLEFDFTVVVRPGKKHLMADHLSRITNGKLKYAGKGPYRVCEITPQGTIRVETLDGIETVRFLNGSKFKRYYDPLSQEELQEMHKKKEAKKQAELKKIQTQIEARERQERIKRQREANLGIAHALQVETDDNSIECDPPLRYPIELNSPYGNVLYNALLDSGARHNLLSYGVWCQIGKPPLSHSTIQVKGINKKKNTVFGILQTPIVYDKGTVDQTFLVMPTGTMEGNINLGRQWMVATKCIIDWGTGSIMTHKPTQNVVTQEITSESELPKKMQDNAKTHIKYQETSLSTAQHLKPSPTWPKKYPIITKSIPYTTKGTYQWVPKASLTTPISRSQTPHTTSFAQLKKHNVTKRWVPKHLLQAQGYYDGNDKIWIPKGKTYLSMSSTKLRGLDTVTSLTIEDRGKGKLDEFSAPNLKLVWISKSDPLLLLSSSKSGSDIASSSSYHSFDICGNASQPPPIIPPIVQTIIDEQLQVRSWKSTLPPLKLDETPRVIENYLPMSLPSLRWTNWFQRMTTSFQGLDPH